MAHKSKSYNYKFQDSLNKFEQSGKFPESFWTAESSWTGWTVSRQYLHFSTHVAKAIYPPWSIYVAKTLSGKFLHMEDFCVSEFSPLLLLGIILIVPHHLNQGCKCNLRGQSVYQGVTLFLRPAGTQGVKTSWDSTPKMHFLQQRLHRSVVWTKLIGCDLETNIILPVWKCWQNVKCRKQLKMCQNIHSLVKMGGMF